MNEHIQNIEQLMRERSDARTALKEATARNRCRADGGNERRYGTRRHSYEHAAREHTPTRTLEESASCQENPAKESGVREGRFGKLRRIEPIPIFPLPRLSSA